MKWTKKLPKVPGWYWHKEKINYIANPMNVDYTRSDGRLYGHRCYLGEAWWKVVEKIGGYWSDSPIKEPKGK